MIPAPILTVLGWMWLAAAAVFLLSFTIGYISIQRQRRLARKRPQPHRQHRPVSHSQLKRDAA